MLPPSALASACRTRGNAEQTMAAASALARGRRCSRKAGTARNGAIVMTLSPFLDRIGLRIRCGDRENARACGERRMRFEVGDLRRNAALARERTRAGERGLPRLALAERRVEVRLQQRAFVVGLGVTRDA